MTELIDNPPPLPDFHVPCWLKHGPYEESEPLSCVFENPSDADCFSALTYLDDVKEKYRAGEAAAFARGVAAGRNAGLEEAASVVSNAYQVSHIRSLKQ